MQGGPRKPTRDPVIANMCEHVMDLNLKNRVAVITGPAKGMGAAITMAFAAEGAKLALLGRDVTAIEPVAAGARPT